MNLQDQRHEQGPAMHRPGAALEYEKRA